MSETRTSHTYLLTKLNYFGQLWRQKNYICIGCNCVQKVSDNKTDLIKDFFYLLNIKQTQNQKFPSSLNLKIDV